MRATVIGRRRRLLPGHRAQWFDRWTIVRLGIVAGAALAAVLAIRAFGRPYVFFDLRIYHGAVVWWWGGGELYDYVAPDITLGFTYPPFAALAMLPMAALPVGAAGSLNVVASLTALAAVLAVLLVPIADRYRWPRWFAVALALPLAAATEPVRETLGYGQVNLLLFGLIAADLVALRWRYRAAVTRAARGAAPRPATGAIGDGLRRLWTEGAWAGVGVGLATAVKLTPALFICYFLITRQWRVALTSFGTAVGVTVATFLVASHESFTYFTSVMWQTERVGVADMTPNQSLAGLLARLYDSRETPGLLWLAFAMLLLAVGLSRASTAHGEGDELAAFTLVGLTANVISPISWSHHLVFVLPAIVVLLDTALRRRKASRGLRVRGPAAGLPQAAAALGTYLLFVVAPIWPYEHQLPRVSHYADGLSGALAENSLALALIALVAALPWRPGAEPAFSAEPAVRMSARVRVPLRDS
jgi:alpha-1,2-mannosyltransferase